MSNSYYRVEYLLGAAWQPYKHRFASYEEAVKAFNTLKKEIEKSQGKDFYSRVYEVRILESRDITTSTELIHARLA